MQQFIAIADTREQRPLEFDSPYIENVITKKLDTGDYSIEGLEDVLCIERKNSINEFYLNCTEARFERELKRMEAYKYRFLVLECSLSEVMDVPYSLGLNQKQTAMCKLKPKYILMRISEIQVNNGVHVVFADTRDGVTEVVTNIMKRVYELESRGV